MDVEPFISLERQNRKNPADMLRTNAPITTSADESDSNTRGYYSGDWEQDASKTQGPVVALLLSLILHLLVLGGIQFKPLTKAEEFEVELLPARERSAQIVSPSEAPETQPPENAKRLSERNSRVRREQIRRGIAEQPASPPSEQVPEREVPEKGVPKKSEPAPKEKAAEQAKNKQTETKPKKSPESNEHVVAKSDAKPRKAPTLRLPTDSLTGTIAANKKTSEKDPTAVDSAQSRLDAMLSSDSSSFSKSVKSDRERERMLREYRPFRSRSAESFFKQRSGSSDYLPDIQDGDLTLLNAKADRHAVFVRRVALQVFGALRRESWAELSSQSIRRLRDYTTIRAVMSPEGRLLEVVFEGGSGVGEFDNLVKKAAQIGAWDKNPPSSAKHADGNIHFIFKARTWSRHIGEARREQRWLLLSTGLL